MHIFHMRELLMAAPRHYVNNRQLYEALVDYRKLIADAKSEGKPKPRIPSYIGECILQIAKRYATKPNFVNYTYIEEMISDAVENCISAGVDNFDPSKTNNPFAYFTQIIHFAFVRRIQKEKKQLYIKYKTMQNSYIMGALTSQQEVDELKEVDSTYLDNDYMNNLVKQYEDTAEEKRKRNREKRKGIETFCEGE